MIIGFFSSVVISKTHNPKWSRKGCIGGIIAAVMLYINIPCRIIYLLQTFLPLVCILKEKSYSSFLAMHSHGLILTDAELNVSFPYCRSLKEEDVYFFLP